MNFIFKTAIFFLVVSFEIYILYLLYGRVKDDKNIKGRIIITKTGLREEFEFGKIESIIAIFTAIAMYTLIALYFRDYLLKFLYSITGDYPGIILLIILLVFVLGNSSALVILSESNLSEERKPHIRPIITWYLMLIFIALGDAYFLQSDSQHDLIKGSVLAFLSGNGFYYLMRKGYGKTTKKDEDL